MLQITSSVAEFDVFMNDFSEVLDVRLVVTECECCEDCKSIDDSAVERDVISEQRELLL